MGVRRRFVSLALAAAVIGLTVPTSSSALVELPGTCIAGTFTSFCRTLPTMDRTFRYQIINVAAEVQWSVGACGTGGCDEAYWLEDPRSGTLTVPACPCFAHVSIPYPGQIVPNPVFNSLPIGIVTSLSP